MVRKWQLEQSKIVNKNIEYLNNRINKFNLMDIYKMLHGPIRE